MRVRACARDTRGMPLIAVEQTDVAPEPSCGQAARIAAEQAALRRVATLVARGVSQDDLFAAVNEEIARLVGADATSLMRFERGDAVTLVAAWSAGGASCPFGERRPVDAVLRSVRETGRAVRFGPAQLPTSGPFVEEARRLGIRTSVGVPIAVDGRVWGVSFAASAGREPFPDDTEGRIAGFAELVATAIADARARSELRRQVEEERALRRVATLVARGASQPELFDAVALEAARVPGDESIAVARYEPEGHVTVVAAHRGCAGFDMRALPEGLGIAATVRRTGQPAREAGLPAAVGVPIIVAGSIWGLIVAMCWHEPLPRGTEGRLAQFAELVATGIAGAERRAELTASRARVVAAADESRRRIERDLHDGAQQRLVHTVITLKLAQAMLGDTGGPVAELVRESLEHAQRATAELRELVHGIMPAALTKGGLRAGVESLVGLVDLPVHVDVTPERLPAKAETTAYFIVAEALTNAVKHAGAASTSVCAAVRDGALRLEVRDDGSGGADPCRGTGLVGLVDRVAASGGTIAITSPPGAGTALAVTLPIR
jgi:signal transduction histidine kinase